MFSLNTVEAVNGLLKGSMKRILLKGFWEIPVNMKTRRLDFLHPPRSKGILALDFQVCTLKACSRALLLAEHSGLIDSTIDKW